MFSRCLVVSILFVRAFVFFFRIVFVTAVRAVQKHDKTAATVRNTKRRLVVFVDANITALALVAFGNDCNCHRYPLSKLITPRPQPAE